MRCCRRRHRRRWITSPHLATDRVRPRTGSTPMKRSTSSPSASHTLTLLRSVGEQLEGGHGLIAVDKSGRILLATQEARRLLDLSGEGEGHTLAELGADFPLLAVVGLFIGPSAI